MSRMSDLVLSVGSGRSLCYNIAAADIRHNSLADTNQADWSE